MSADKWDLPTAVSKLRYTTTKLRPRDGLTRVWKSQFNDLLAINGLSDYIVLSPPLRSSFFARYDNPNEAENAFAAAPAVYQFWNGLLYHLVMGCIDLTGTDERLDLNFI